MDGSVLDRRRLYCYRQVGVTLVHKKLGGSSYRVKFWILYACSIDKRVLLIRGFCWVLLRVLLSSSIVQIQWVLSISEQRFGSFNIGLIYNIDMMAFLNLSLCYCYHYYCIFWLYTVSWCCKKRIVFMTKNDQHRFCRTTETFEARVDVFGIIIRL